MELSLTTIILGEIIFTLSVALIFSGVILVRWRRRYRHLLEEFQRQQRTIRVNPGQELQHSAHFEQSAQGSDHSLEFFLQQTLDDAKQRYTLMTQSSVPRLAADQPFGAKIAALRYLYLSAEYELLRQRKSPQQGWILLERKLYDIVRWIVDRKQQQRGQRNNQVRLLQQRVEALKKYETENRNLRRKLSLNKLKQERLSDDLVANRNTISKLENINESLHQTLARQVPATHLQQASVNWARSDNQLHTIRDLSQEKRRLTGALTENLQRLTDPEYEPQRARLQRNIHKLEQELDESGQTVAALQRQLDAAQAALNPERPREIHEQPLNPQQPAQDSAHTPLLQAWQQGNGHQQTVEDIQHLRTNNQRQRAVIVELEKELRSLRTTPAEQPSTGAGEPAATGNPEVAKLEQLVRECEHCIDTLESEVDMLQEQLQQGLHAAPQHLPLEQKMQKDAITQLNHELDMITSKLEHTLKQHREDSVLRRLAVETLELNSLDALGRRLVLTLRELQLGHIGFHLESRLGSGDYFSARDFTSAERTLVRNCRTTAPVAYLNEGLLFSAEHIQLLLKPAANKNLPADAEATLCALVNLINARIHAMEAETLLARQQEDLTRWGSDTRNLLTRLDMQYAERAEKEQRVIHNLLEELERAASLVAMDDMATLVFDNALTECRDQLRALAADDGVADEDYDALLTRLEQLSSQAAPAPQP